MKAKEALDYARNSISKGLEDYFYRHGLWVATHPKWTISASLVAVALCSLGLLRFHEEKDMSKLWLPADSDFVVNNDWLWKNHPPDVRYNSLILEDEQNILRPDVLKQMHKIHKAVKKIKTEEGNLAWEDVCIRLPVVDMDKILADIFGKRRRKRELEDFDEAEADADFEAIRAGRGRGGGADPAVLFYPEQYCPIVRALPTECFEVSLLEMLAEGGSYDDAAIERKLDSLATAEDVVDLVNRVNVR